MNVSLLPARGLQAFLKFSTSEKMKNFQVLAVHRCINLGMSTNIVERLGQTPSLLVSSPIGICHETVLVGKQYTDMTLENKALMNRNTDQNII